MMNELMQVFGNDDFGQVRSVDVKGEPWLMGKDIATILGYADTDKAVRDHVDDEDKQSRRISGISGVPAVFINESGLYSLALSSKLPGAKKFRRWITSDVLPTLRQEGAYGLAAMRAKTARLNALVKERAERNRSAKSLIAGIKDGALPKDSTWRDIRTLLMTTNSPDDAIVVEDATPCTPVTEPDAVTVDTTTGSKPVVGKDLGAETQIKVYLDTLLPQTWGSYDLQKRRIYLAADPFEGVERKNVCVSEIWCECFNQSRCDLTILDSRNIAEHLRALGWQATDRRIPFPLYGKQRVWTRKE